MTEDKQVSMLQLYSEESDYDLLNCVYENQYGIDAKHIFLKKRSLNPIWQ